MLEVWHCVAYPGISTLQNETFENSTKKITQNHHNHHHQDNFKNIFKQMVCEEHEEECALQTDNVEIGPPLNYKSPLSTDIGTLNWRVMLLSFHLGGKARQLAAFTNVWRWHATQGDGVNLEKTSLDRCHIMGNHITIMIYKMSNWRNIHPLRSLSLNYGLWPLGGSGNNIYCRLFSLHEVNGNM